MNEFDRVIAEAVTAYMITAPLKEMSEFELAHLTYAYGSDVGRPILDAIMEANHG